MFLLRLPILLALLLFACRRPDAPARVATTMASPGPIVDAAVAADAAADAPPRPRFDAAQLVGYVRGVGVPEVAHRSGALTSVAVEELADDRARWRFQVTDADGETHGFGLEVPSALPMPLAKNTRVSFEAAAHGGGPNRVYDMLVTAADGTLLLAVGILPEGWTIERGKVLRSQRAERYVERTYAVNVTYNGRSVSVADKWVDFGDYAVWASAASRTLDPHRIAPVDFVGGWLDFAIFRR